MHGNTLWRAQKTSSAPFSLPLFRDVRGPSFDIASHRLLFDTPFYEVLYDPY